MTNGTGTRDKGAQDTTTGNTPTGRFSSRPPLSQTPLAQPPKVQGPVGRAPEPIPDPKNFIPPRLSITRLKELAEKETHPRAKATWLYALGAELEIHRKPKPRGSSPKPSSSTSSTRHIKQAVQTYLEAFHTDPSFRPPLFALVRIFETHPSTSNLERLYQAEATHAPDTESRASAWIDQANLYYDVLKQPQRAMELYGAALQSGHKGQIEHTAALHTEYVARALRDEAHIRRSISTRAGKTENPVLASLLAMELAEHDAHKNQLELAIQTLRQSLSLGANQWHILEELEWLGRKFNRDDVLREALLNKARLAELASKGGTSELLLLGHVATVADAAHMAATLRIEAELHHPNAPRPEQQPVPPEPEGNGVHTAPPGTPMEPWVSTRATPGPSTLEKLMAYHRGQRDLGDALFRDATQDETASPLTVLHRATTLIENWHHRRRLDETAVPSSVDLERMYRLWQQHPNQEGLSEATDVLWTATGNHTSRYNLWDQSQDHPRALWVALQQLGDLQRAETQALKWMDAQPEHTSHATRIMWMASHSHQDLQRLKLWGERLAKDPSVGTGEQQAIRFIIHAHNPTQLPAAQQPEGRPPVTQAMDTPKPEGSTQGNPGLLEGAQNTPWMSELLRLDQAAQHRWKGVADAHLNLANLVTSNQIQLEHLLAASRALVVQKQWEQARTTLRQALDLQPNHPIAVPWLERTLQELGDTEGIIELRQHAAEHTEDPEHAELHLLLASRYAVSQGHVAEAIAVLQRARSNHPDSLAPLWSLKELGEQQQDMALLRQAREGLASLETHAPKIESFELGEHYDFRESNPEMAEPIYQDAIQHPWTQDIATLSLCLLPSGITHPSTRAQALLQYLETDDPHTLQWLVTELLAAEETSLPLERACRALAHREPGNPWALYGATQVRPESTANQAQRAAGWLALGKQHPDPTLGCELRLQGIRSAITVATPTAMDDAFLLAQDMIATFPERVQSAIAFDETTGPSDDPTTRAEALQTRLIHASASSQSPLERGLARTLVAAGDHRTALPLLQRITRQDPEDLCSWEQLRVAARHQHAWQDLFQACMTLAQATGSPWKLDLLEEAATVCMEHLNRKEEAIAILKEALRLDPKRDLTYRLLHGLYGDRGDNQALLALVQERLETFHEPGSLVPLLYEKARLLRATGEREAALEVIRQLIHLHPAHVAARALMAEVQSTLGHWPDAIQSLSQLADLKVPHRQQRLALLGAADIAERQLHNPTQALQFVLDVEQRGLKDKSLLPRMARLAQAAHRPELEARALQEELDTTPGPTRTQEIRKRFAELALASSPTHPQENGPATDDARPWLEALLKQDPQHLWAAAQLDKHYGVGAMEPLRQEILQALNSHPTHAAHLRRAMEFATATGDRDLQQRVHQVLQLFHPSEGDLTAPTLHGPGDLPSFQALPSSEPPDDPLALLCEVEDSGEIQLRDVTKAVQVVHRLLRMATPALMETEGRTLEHLKRKQPHLRPWVHNHPTRDELLRWSHSFQVYVEDVYENPNASHSVDLVAGNEGAVWVVSPAILEKDHLTLTQQFRVGQRLAAWRLSALPFVDRNFRQCQTLLKALVDEALAEQALAEQTQTELTRGDKTETHMQAAMIWSSLTPAQKQQAQRELASLGTSTHLGTTPSKELKFHGHGQHNNSLGDDNLGEENLAGAAEQWHRHINQVATQSGMIPCDQLRVGLSWILGPKVRAPLVQQSPPAMALVRFWLSETMGSLTPLRQHNTQPGDSP